jgi:hypothetical protein
MTLSFIGTNINATNFVNVGTKFSNRVAKEINNENKDISLNKLYTPSIRFPTQLTTYLPSYSRPILA